MAIAGRTRAARIHLRSMIVFAAAVAVAGCRAPEPRLAFLDQESSLSFTHPPHWSVGFAEQDGLRYRYVTAPTVGNEAQPLSITLIPPTPIDSANLLAQAYLTGATNIVQTPAASGSTEWSFKDSSRMPSRLRIRSAGRGRFFGAWARGSEAAMQRYSGQLDALLSSLAVEEASEWPEERFGGMATKAPLAWTRGSRLSNATNATMQFKSLPLAVDKGTYTIHGFITLSKEPVPAPGDLEAFSLMLKNRASDTLVVQDRRPWAPPGGAGNLKGYVDYLRSGTTISASRSRRWIMARSGVGLILVCEARADAFDRLDPWCERMAGTVRLE